MEAYLAPGEHVRLSARPHGVALVRPLARALAWGAAGGAAVLLGRPLHWLVAALGAAAICAAALAALRAVWRWDRTVVVLTSEKLLVVYGIAKRRAAAVRLDRVQAVEVEQGLWGRLLGYGTLVAGNLEIPYVPGARDVVRLLR
ncbi:MAG: PH domain-containing protein [Thermoleophilia bacterium]|nr:PH domain-containing protein [Thermoleophilia bacterium]